MRFEETTLAGAYVIEIDPIRDERGFFARTFCRREFQALGLEADIAQCNLALSHRAGTLRGLHYQLPPATESKLVRCIRGSILDVIVDLRPASPTYLQHAAIELSSDNHRALLVPPMFAHGYQTLLDDTEVLYQVSEFYTPGAESGLRFDDPRLGIRWPLKVVNVSDKDQSWPLLESS